MDLHTTPYLPATLLHGDTAPDQTEPARPKELECRECGIPASEGDSVQLRLCGCVLCEACMPCRECHEEDAAPCEPALTPLPPGTPRCGCGCVLLPHSLRCPLCDKDPEPNVPLEITGDVLAGVDPLDIGDWPTPF